MNVIEAIKGRYSARAFLDKPVEKGTIEKILDTARWAPSGVNTQPWHVVMAGRETMREIGDTIVAAKEAGQEPNPDYKYYPDKFVEPYRTRRVVCGKALYGALDIQRDDTKRRKEAWFRNYYGFGALVELFISIDRSLAQGSWLDLGMFIQNIMLAAREQGLETCPQAALAEHPDIIREVLDIPAEQAIVCGIAIGYADPKQPVNNYRTEREAVETFTVWRGVE